ncbi:general vesicular transport factor p115 isoform X1 [Tachypleus tridentatus]|uniref:general vesicular transport factor p115 isoform X1 n=1 Tax=Tachypleus tridentatus TaxID=6853 RepID=UPI003FD22EF6
MDYLKSGLKSVLGAQADSQQPTAAETVERLVERVQTSTLLDDRRDACRALKSMSKKYRVEVGAQAMDALIYVIEMDRSDAEIVGYALDALSNVISGPQDDEDYIEGQEEQDLGTQFTEIYIKRTENVTLLLDLLEEFDFKVRWPAVKLFTGLLECRPKELQECVLVSPMGVSRLMDLLSDSREVIRNDTLLLLVNLTKGNANIQKIVAFENAFDKLLDIIAEEGYSDGGVVVEDSLAVLLNLLKNNSSNQNFFKEGSYIQRLTPYFELQGDSSGGDMGWSAQKVSNLHLMLQVIRTLVSPNNPLQVISSCQKVMNQSGLLEQLCNILMASGVPADILTETINTVAEVIRGHHANQEYFATVSAPSSPPRPAIVVLLMSMVNEKQQFVLRCAVLYCFQCFLYKNELGQAQIVQTLLPTSADMTTITAGQLLCGGLFSLDCLSNWFAAVALSHSLVDNPTQKEQLLRVQLATSVGNPPISLMKQCTTILQQGGKVQTRLGLLMLLSTWLAHSTQAVSHFLSIPTNIPYLTSQVGLAEGDEHEDLVQGLCAFLLGICIEFNDDSIPSFTRENLCQLILKRIGQETFFDKLGSVSKHELYSRAAQKPHLKYKQPSEVLFDYEFCRLFKSLEGAVIRAVQPKPKDLVNGPESNMTVQQHSLLQQYKDVIREQDQRLNELQKDFNELKSENEKSQSHMEEMTSTIQQLRDQNALLKAQRVASQSAERSGSPSSIDINNLQHEKEELQKQLENLEKNLKEQKDSYEKLKKELEEEKEKKQADAEKQEPLINDSELIGTLEHQRQEITELKQTINRLEEEVKTKNEISGEKQGELSKLAEEKRRLQQRLARVNDKNQKLEDEKSRILKEKQKIQEELDSTKKEQEDLLILLTEQDNKLTAYKKKLRELGEKVEDDDEDDLNEDEANDDEDIDEM